MAYKLNITRSVTRTADEMEEEKRRRERNGFRGFNDERDRLDKDFEEVLTVELTEEQWKAVKKAVIEAC